VAQIFCIENFKLTRNWTRIRTGLLLKKLYTDNKMQYIIGNGEKITDDNSE